MESEEIKKIENRVKTEVAKQLWDYDWDDDMFIDFQITNFIKDELKINRKEFQ